MKNEPKDIAGKPVKIGDKVAYMVKGYGNRSDLLIGAISAITESVQKFYRNHVWDAEARRHVEGEEQSYWTKPSFTIAPDFDGRKVVEKDKVVLVESAPSA